MREIIFRGKRVDNGEWAHGDLRQIEGHVYILDYDIGDNGIDDLPRLFNIAYEVIPETVGQFTGQRDSKRTKEYPEGQPIYEGDEAKTGDDYGSVRWHEELAAYVVDFGGDYEHLSDLVVEVIGNIYDNGDLLK